MEEKKKGGKRPGAGRRRLDDPKEQIALYVHQTAISRFGGKDGLKNALYGFIYGSAVPDSKLVTFKKKERAAEVPAALSEPEAQKSSPAKSHESILAQIEAIRAEKIPKDRDTYLGRKVWQNEQNARIEALKQQLK